MYVYKINSYFLATVWHSSDIQLLSFLTYFNEKCWSFIDFDRKNAKLRQICKEIGKNWLLRDEKFQTIKIMYKNKYSQLGGASKRFCIWSYVNLTKQSYCSANFIFKIVSYSSRNLCSCSLSKRSHIIPT